MSNIKHYLDSQGHCSTAILCWSLLCSTKVLDHSEACDSNLQQRIQSQILEILSHQCLLYAAVGFERPISDMLFQCLLLISGQCILHLLVCSL